MSCLLIVFFSAIHLIIHLQNRYIPRILGRRFALTAAVINVRNSGYICNNLAQCLEM